MPEGPEIRIAADRIGRVLVGAAPTSVFFAFAGLKAFERELTGQQIIGIGTHGKAMLTKFAHGLTIYSHNQLYGRWFTSKPGETPGTRRSLRLALHTELGSAWLYSASEIEVLDESGLASHRFLSRLGPDILDATLSPQHIVQRLRDPRFSGRSLAALYLDQRFLAGLGNYLRSEILFTAGLAPGLRPRDLSDQACERLARETLVLARRSYQTRGITLDDVHRTTRAGARSSGRGRQRFWLFDREGQRCYRCEQTIQKEISGSRRLYRCPGCQV